MSPFRSILVIHNPTAGSRRRRRVDALMRGLESSGIPARLLGTNRPGDAEAAARMAGAEGSDLIVAAGGDGTVNEIANGLAAASVKVPFALLPMGTANVLAAEMGQGAAPGEVLAAIRDGRRRPIRLGLAAGRHFVLMASVGVDAAVVHGLDLAFKRRAGRLAYGVEALRQGGAYAYPPLEVHVDGTPHRACMVVACNASRYGGPFVAAPGADPGDGKLHAVLLERAGAGALLRYGAALALGRLARLPDVRVVAGSVISVACGEAAAPAQADGDPLGNAPLTMSVSDQTIEMVVP